MYSNEICRRTCGTNNYVNKLTSQNVAMSRYRRIIGPIQASWEKYPTISSKICNVSAEPLSFEKRISHNEVEFRLYIKYHAWRDFPLPPLPGRAIKNNILEYVGNNSVSSFVDTYEDIRAASPASFYCLRELLTYVTTSCLSYRVVWIKLCYSHTKSNKERWQKNFDGLLKMCNFANNIIYKEHWPP